MAMNKTIAIILCGALMIMGGCSPSDNYKSLKTAEQLMEENPDSAWHLLGRIDKTLLKEGKELALYHLLYAQAQYKLYMPETNDSILAYSLRYYTMHGNSHQKATVYYYKSAIAYDLGKREEAVEYIKNAECYAEDTDDELLKNKIFDMLCHINENTANRALALKYAKMFLNSSIVLGDTEQICRACDDVALEFRAIKQYDSCRYYREKCIELLPKTTILTYRYLSNYAEDLINEGKYDEAKRLLLVADSMAHRPYQYNLLADIALHERDTIMARQYWEKSIEYDDYGTSIEAYRKLAVLHYQRHDFRTAYDRMKTSDSLTYAFSEYAKSASLMMYQKEFDLAQADLEASRLQNRWLMALLLSVFLLSGCIIFYLLKARRLKTVVSKNIIALNEAKNEVEHLRQTDENHGKMVSQLNMKIQRLNEEMALRLGTGKEIYEKVVRRESLAGFTADDEQCLIDYYAYTYSQRFASLLLPYQSPTRRLVTYLIMCDMGLSDKEIQQVLRISSSTIRSYRYRLK